MRQWTLGGQLLAAIVIFCLSFAVTFFTLDSRDEDRRVAELARQKAPARAQIFPNLRAGQWL